MLFQGVIRLSDNWVVQALQSAFNIWNDKLTEIWSLVTTTPQEFRGGDIWNAVVGINEGLKAIGYGLLVLFFAMGIFQSAASFREIQRPEYALRHLISDSRRRSGRGQARPDRRDG